ncbi:MULTISPECIES: hypothetical protein [unclassified Cupriavidus]|uniref:hypothetical protein n=1 Tax=unclassified Cupriavidus TaxID=2640874 RepID=UPI00313CD3AA
MNVIEWPSVREKFCNEISTLRLLDIYGQWQADGEVRHLVAQYAMTYRRCLARWTRSADISADRDDERQRSERRMRADDSSVQILCK